MSEMKILMLSSAPGDAARLRLDREAESLREALRRARMPGRLRLETRFAVDSQSLLRALLNRSWRLSLLWTWHLRGRGY